MNSAQELEHFERIRRTFESATAQEKQGSAPHTIGEAIDGLSPGSEITENGSAVVNGTSHEHDSKGKGKAGMSSMRSLSGGVPSIGRGKGRILSAMHAAAGGGKGKSKTVVPKSGGDSDSSFDGYQPGSRNGSTQQRGGGYEDLGEEGDDDGDGVEDGDDDEYVVRTDHLKTTDYDDVD